MKPQIIVGVSLILASTSCIFAFGIALTSPHANIGIVFLPFAWLVYLGLGYAVMLPIKKDELGSDLPTPCGKEEG